MYLRFTTTSIDEDSKKPRGVFIEAYRLLDSGDLSRDEWSRLRKILDWFKQNLKTPEKFKTGRAIFWFRDDAKECIDKIWDMVHMLRQHDCHIVVHKCRHLHNRTYSDDMQVAAFPHPMDDRIIEH